MRSAGAMKNRSTRLALRRRAVRKIGGWLCSFRTEIAFFDRKRGRKSLSARLFVCLHWLTREILYKIFQKSLDFGARTLQLNCFMNLRQIEVEITVDCDLKCPNCNRSCGQAPSRESLSFAQVEHFITESVRAGRKWSVIRLSGGEPTLHDRILDICRLFLIYKKRHSPRTIICLVTNGYGPGADRIIRQLPAGIHVENSRKTPGPQAFASYNVAPIDLRRYQDRKTNFARGCDVLTYCGMALTRNGYYPCGPGAAVDRVLGRDLGIKKLDRVDRRALRERLKGVCPMCGHFKDGRDALVTSEEISPSWIEAYRRYGERKPALSLFGDDDRTGGDPGTLDSA
jgi:hypothetical protein